MTLCATPISETVYNGKDNVLTLVLDADGAVLVDLSGLTRATVDIDGGTTVIDSDLVASSVIWWTDTVQHLGVTTDVLRLKLGGQSITAGTYTGVDITVYDTTYPNGLQVENNVTLTVVD